MVSPVGVPHIDPSSRRGVVVSAPAAIHEGWSLAESWALFLGRYKWDWFCTFTFSAPTHPEAADKVFRMFVRELNEFLYGKRRLYPGGGVYWVRALEWQKREVLHYHALMGDVEDLNARTKRLQWMDRWGELAGFAKIERPTTNAAVAAYCSKYVAKGGEIDVSASLKNYAEQISAVPQTR